jgi:ATP-dependent DNA helicase RecQ
VSNIQHILKQYWGYNTFRPLQEQIIRSVLDKKDTIALLPTGGGKSICFQVPAIALPGTCIVVSPLISLMEDQVRQLKNRGISAGTINSSLSKKEVEHILQRTANGEYKLLYLSPERLQTFELQRFLGSIQISFIAVDEAHCISEWGYDFRPTYLEIAKIKKYLPDLSFIALTGTATALVLKDIEEKLVLKNTEIFKQSFRRDNLQFLMIKEDDKLQRLKKICQKINYGSGIVYVRSRKHAEEVSSFLNYNQISSMAYHAGLKYEERNTIQSVWVNNQCRVIVATNAFGMGIDKSDVSFVIHLELPESPENYYQEAGRAGRDGKLAYSVVLWQRNDCEELLTKVEAQYPDIQVIKQCYQALANYYQLAIGAGEGVTLNFDIITFCNAYQLEIKQTHYALKLLERQGYLQMNEAYYKPSKLQIIATKDVLYNYQVKNKRADKIIKALERNYEGIYGKPVNVRESKLAAITKLDLLEIEQTLDLLHQNKVIEYHQHNDSASITFLAPREDAKNIRLSPENLRLRREYALMKAKAIIEVVENDLQCRSISILKYFNEEQTTICGKCDVCLRRNKSSVIDISTAKTIVLQLLKRGPLHLDQIIINTHTLSESTIIEALRELVDDGIIEREKMVYRMS